MARAKFRAVGAFFGSLDGFMRRVRKSRHGRFLWQCGNVSRQSPGAFASANISQS
jgi:hypothetical protein